MKKEIAPAWARLRGSLYATRRREPHGTCRVLQADLELLLAEVEQLSNAQFARYLIRIVLEELNHGDSAPEGTSKREAKRRGRGRSFLRGPDSSAAVGGMDAVSGPFTFPPEGSPSY